MCGGKHLTVQGIYFDACNARICMRHSLLILLQGCNQEHIIAKEAAHLVTQARFRLTSHVFAKAPVVQ